MPKKRLPLTARQQPILPRAAQSVDLILQTTARLLDEVGIERFNTNLLAERAGIRVRTVYRYFPNKYAIIKALTEKLAIHWDSWMSALYAQIADPQCDWRMAVIENAKNWLQNARNIPAGLTALQAMNATPELAHLHFQIFEEMSHKMGIALASRGVRLPAAKLMAVARAWTSSMNAGAELYLKLKDQEAALFLEELCLSQQASLERYISDIERLAKPGVSSASAVAKDRARRKS
jgi:AcrR family transcriptional regulator